MKKKYTVLLLIVFNIYISCGERKKQPNNQTSSHIEYAYQPNYAKGFHLTYNNGVKTLTVSNPWQGASNVSFTYYLTPNADPKKMNEIKTPVERVICLSTTHIAYIDALNQTATINGVSGSNYISNSTIQKGLADKRVIDVGYESGLSFEAVVTLHPDVVFAYGISGELNSIVDKLNELGIKVVFLGDYLEETPLGKTEWLVAVAAFFNAEESAKELLNPIFDSYTQLVNKVKSDTNILPKVMLNAPWKDSWFVPGGKSYMANLIKDAGGDFIIGNNDKRDSYPMSIEKAYNDALKADYWLNPNAAQNLDEIKQMDARLANIPAFKAKKVYNNNAKITAGGGSDFWESGVMSPHIILSDLIKILHPQIINEHELVYYHQLR